MRSRLDAYEEGAAAIAIVSSGPKYEPLLEEVDATEITKDRASHLFKIFCADSGEFYEMYSTRSRSRNPFSMR